ncbi:MAG TPA: amidohydrolase, partial [Chitinophagaceae bacterium]|nr:amidohydrolase [Chitinophagaceae bacterium]
MKKILFALIATGLLTAASSQSTILPAEKQKGLVFIKNATIHVGNGKVIEKGTIKIQDGKIAEVGASVSIPAGDV